MSTWTEAPIANPNVTIKGEEYTITRIITAGGWFEHFLTRNADGLQVTTRQTAKRNLAKNAALYELDRKTRAN